jgi:hypothetical protein
MLPRRPPFAKRAAVAYLRTMTGTDARLDMLIAGLPDAALPPVAYPVEQWHPPHCGDSGMRIDREGRWFHEGREIRRPALVSLFARLLRREPDGRHVLVTPVEMLDIAVEDAPLVVIALTSEGEGRDRRLRFRIGATGAWVEADAAHPLLVDTHAGQPRPYLELPAGLRARLARPVYYELAELALAEPHSPPGLWSGGAFHLLEPRS